MNSKCCCPCLYWRQSQYPIFDYDEIDDLEFDNLLFSPTQPFVQTSSTWWQNIASLFGYHPSVNNDRGYSRVVDYQTMRSGDGQDILADQSGVADAKLLTREQVLQITRPFVNYPAESQMSINLEPKSEIITNIEVNQINVSPTEIPMGLKDSNLVEEAGSEQVIVEDIVVEQSVSNLPPDSNDETSGERFNADLLSTLTRTKFSDTD